VKYTARAPLRVDLGSSWTCLPAIAEQIGGTALCAAISIYAEGSIALPAGDSLLMSLRSQRRYVSYSLDLPLGAGLGASAAQTVLYVALLRSVVDNAADRREVARISCQLNGMMGTLSGQQDAYASAIGGVSYLSVTSRVEAERVEPATSAMNELAGRMVVLWSGEAGRSLDVATTLQSEFKKGRRELMDGLAELNAGATSIRDALVSEEIDRAVELVDEQWRRQQKILPESSPPRVREVAELARKHGATAVNGCGIAGGALVAFCRAGDREHFMNAMKASKVRVLDAGIDTFGVHLRKA
jgi:galactokinase/mevalonate kinase-like predicted kinase